MGSGCQEWIFYNEQNKSAICLINLKHMHEKNRDNFEPNETLYFFFLIVFGFYCYGAWNLPQKKREGQNLTRRSQISNLMEIVSWNTGFIVFNATGL